MRHAQVATTMDVYGTGPDGLEAPGQQQGSEDGAQNYGVSRKQEAKGKGAIWYGPIRDLGPAKPLKVGLCGVENR